MKTGKLIVLSAPSGAGKTSICKELLKKNKEWKFSVSGTTREMREDEVDGVDYIFMKKEKFDHLEKFGEFIESEWVHGNKYGTLIDPLENSIELGHTMILDIDVRGAMNIIEEFPEETISIFIEPPGFDSQEKIESLRERMQSRDNPNETLIKQRLKRYDLEFSFKEKFDHSFINDNLNKVTSEIEKIIKEKI